MDLHPSPPPPSQDVYRKLGITADAVAAKGAAMLAYYKTHAVPPVPINGPVL